MTHQAPVTVRAEIKPGHESTVDGLLAEIGSGGPHVSLRLAEVPGVHFARLFVLPALTLQSGRRVPPTLVYMADVDGSVGRHLRDLLVKGGAGVEALFEHCVGYPSGRGDDERNSWLSGHTLQPAAYYAHAVGRTVTQARDEARLRDGIQQILDSGELDTADTTPAVLRQRLREAVLRRRDFTWASKGPPGPGLVHDVRETAHLAAGLVALVLAAPLLVPTAAVWALLVRAQERRETPESGAPDQGHVDVVRRYEDHGAQNPFTAIGEVKPGLVRRVTMRVGLAGLDFACRHAYARDNLAGVDSIHFARWVPLDDGDRLIFASSYDGSLESYMDDFISRLSWGINLIFSNGVGFPGTRWLVLGGARDEISYKHYLRRHQVPTVVFYSAYDDHTARNLDTFTEIRAGLSSGDRADAGHWVSLL